MRAGLEEEEEFPGTHLRARLRRALSPGTRARSVPREAVKGPLKMCVCVSLPFLLFVLVSLIISSFFYCFLFDPPLFLVFYDFFPLLVISPPPTIS